ncbi:flavodoxin domain-containing protein [Oceanobacillus sp. CAU 1775]
MKNMKKVLMLYTSLTGNTEIMAEEMLDELKSIENIQLESKLFDENIVSPKDLLKYDIIFFGIYTWVDGDVPIDAEEFFDRLHKIDLTGKVFGIFGSADSNYPDYGTAVTMFYEQLEKLGGTMVPDQIISNVEPTAEDLIRCRKMVRAAFDSLSQ